MRDSISDHLGALRQLTVISAAGKHLDTMQPLVEAKLAELAQVIELRRDHDMTALLAMVSSGQGKRLMDSIRGEMNSFIRIEEDVLAQNDAAFQSNMRRLFSPHRDRQPVYAAVCPLVCLLDLPGNTTPAQEFGSSRNPAFA